MPRASIVSLHILIILPSETHSHSPGLEGGLTANPVSAHFVHSSSHMTEEKWKETPLLKLGPTDRTQFLESQQRKRESGGQPSQGLGSVLHGRVSK